MQEPFPISIAGRNRARCMDHAKKIPKDEQYCKCIHFQRGVEIPLIDVVGTGKVEVTKKSWEELVSEQIQTCCFDANR